MAKHHLDLDFSTQDMEEVDKEILTGHPSDETTNNVDMMEDDAVITTGSPVDPSFFFSFFWKKMVLGSFVLSMLIL